MLSHRPSSAHCFGSRARAKGTVLWATLPIPPAKSRFPAVLPAGWLGCLRRTAAGSRAMTGQQSSAATGHPGRPGDSATSAVCPRCDLGMAERATNPGVCGACLHNAGSHTRHRLDNRWTVRHGRSVLAAMVRATRCLRLAADHSASAPFRPVSRADTEQGRQAAGNRSGHP
jgi:hypothetical protein